jgi:hypothetical protein
MRFFDELVVIRDRAYAEVKASASTAGMSTTPTPAASMVLSILGRVPQGSQKVVRLPESGKSSGRE